MKDKIIDVLKAIIVAKKTFQRIKINFYFAFLYNIILIPIAMGLLYPGFHFKMEPMYAAIAMALSSVSVITSSIFLKFIDPEKEINEYKNKKDYFRDSSLTVELFETKNVCL